jgi:hypothetical protein
MGEHGPVLVTDLICGAEALAERLRDALLDEQWLDAYLLAASAVVILNDPDSVKARSALPASRCVR